MLYRSRKHHKINGSILGDNLSYSVNTNGTDVASNDSYAILLQLAGGARLFALDP